MPFYKGFRASVTLTESALMSQVFRFRLYVVRISPRGSKSLYRLRRILNRIGRPVS